MKNYELIQDGKFYKQCYASNIKQARDIFNHEFFGKFDIICTGNDWERRKVILK